MRAAVDMIVLLIAGAHLASGIVTRASASVHEGLTLKLTVNANGLVTDVAAAQDTTPPRISLDRNEEAVARANNLPVADDTVGLIAIPSAGTTPATRFRLSGYARADLIRSSARAGVSDLFTPASIPIGPAPRQSPFDIQVRQSRLNFELRRPAQVSSSGLTMRVFFEFDLFGPSQTTAFHLRHAYAQVLGPWGHYLLMGQTYSPFTDIDAFPSTVDFEGPNSATMLLTPVVQYTVPVKHKWSLAISVAKPQSDIRHPDSAVAVTEWPDVVFRLRYGWPSSGGHAQFAALWRQVGYDSGSVEARATGFGFQGSAVIGLRDGDNLQFDLLYGRGIGRYVNDLPGDSLDAAQANSGTLTTFPTLGGYAGLQHFWSHGLYSELTAGLLRLYDTNVLGARGFRRSVYSAINFTAIDVPFLPSGCSVAVEALYGYHQENDQQSAAAERGQVGLTCVFYGKAH